MYWKAIAMFCIPLAMVLAFFITVSIQSVSGPESLLYIFGLGIIFAVVIAAYRPNKHAAMPFEKKSMR